MTQKLSRVELAEVGERSIAPILFVIVIVAIAFSPSGCLLNSYPNSDAIAPLFAEMVLPGAGIILPGAGMVLPGAGMVLPGAEMVLQGAEIVQQGAEIVLHLLHNDFCNGKKTFYPLPFICFYAKRKIDVNLGVKLCPDTKL